MRAQAYWIPGPWKGALAISPRPRGGDWLEDEVAGWRESGIQIVVSLLEPEEVAELNLERESDICEAYGIRFLSFPIPDRGLPASAAAAVALVNNLDLSLGKGEKLAIHCRQGIGRSAMLAACLLIASGVEPDKAFHQIAAARGAHVPDTPEQEQWVIDHLTVPATHP